MYGAARNRSAIRKQMQNRFRTGAATLALEMTEWIEPGENEYPAFFGIHTAKKLRPKSELELWLVSQHAKANVNLTSIQEYTGIEQSFPGSIGRLQRGCSDIKCKHRRRRDSQQPNAPL